MGLFCRLIDWVESGRLLMIPFPWGRYGNDSKVVMVGLERLKELFVVGGGTVSQGEKDEVTLVEKGM